MKIETKDVEPGVFKPFKIEITIESWRDLEWLLTISNCSHATANSQIPFNNEIFEFEHDNDSPIQMALFEALKKEYYERKSD